MQTTHDEANEKSELENRKFREMLKKNLPRVFEEMVESGKISLPYEKLRNY